MASSLGYALAGAAVGVGNQITKMADERRAMARTLLLQKNKTDARAGERAEDRRLGLEVRDNRDARQDAQRAETRGFQVEDRNYRVANRRPLRGGLGRRKPVSISKDMFDRLTNWLGDEDLENEAARRMREMMSDAQDNGETLGEQQAWDILHDIAEYGDDTTEGGASVLGLTLREGRTRPGPVIGFGSGGAATGPDAVGTEPMPMPTNPDDLVVGEVYSHPETGENIRWDGTQFVVVE